MQEYTPEQIEQYTHEVKDICANHKHCGMIFKKKQYLYDFVEWRTSKFLADPFYTFRTKLYWVVHDLVDFPKCQNPECGKPLEWKNIDSVPRGYCKYCCNSCAQKSEETKKKIELTCMKRHGVRFPSASEQSKNKVRDAWKQKTKEEIDERTRKTKQTLKDRYGDENYNNVELTMLHDRINHGGKLACQTEEGKEKRRLTCQKKWNVDYPSQRNEFRELVRTTWSKKTSEEIRAISDERQSGKKKIFHDGIWFDSKWEIFVYDHCKKMGIEFEYHPPTPIEYKYDNREWLYYPDFKIEGKLYEVKGDQFFRINETTGMEEMFCPWKGNLSDKEYSWKCGKAEAKHQCMISNGVVILRENEIKHLDEVIKNGCSK